MRRLVEDRDDQAIDPPADPVEGQERHRQIGEQAEEAQRQPAASAQEPGQEGRALRPFQRVDHAAAEDRGDQGVEKRSQAEHLELRVDLRPVGVQQIDQDLEAEERLEPIRRNAAADALVEEEEHRSGEHPGHEQVDEVEGEDNLEAPAGLGQPLTQGRGDGHAISSGGAGRRERGTGGESSRRSLHGQYAGVLNAGALKPAAPGPGHAAARAAARSGKNARRSC